MHDGLDGVWSQAFFGVWWERKFSEWIELTKIKAHCTPSGTNVFNNVFRKKPRMSYWFPFLRYPLNGLFYVLSVYEVEHGFSMNSNMDSLKFFCKKFTEPLFAKSFSQFNLMTFCVCLKLLSFRIYPVNGLF